MTFLNAMLALGAATCVIPVVIHLLNRRRFNVVQWGAMHLITPLVRTNRKRIRLEQLILLLIRMAILALLALCMAGPILTGWHALSGNAKVSLALLLDNSYSMQAGAVGETNFGVAKKNAARLIDHQRRGSDVTVALMAGGKTFGSRPTTNRQRSSKEIAELSPGFRSTDIGDSFDTVTRSLVKMQHAKRDLVIISDFQVKDWGDDSATRLDRAIELADSMPIPPAITLMKLGVEATDNVSVQSIEVSPRFVAIDQPVSLRVHLRNHGQVPYPGVRVRLRIDDNDKEAATIDLGGGKDGQLLFTHTFADPGSHVVEVQAEADALHVDNGYVTVVPVWDRLPVLLVDGDWRPETLESETGFLQLALSPFLTAASAQGQADPALPRADLLKATTRRLSEFVAADLESKRVVVLANVEKLDDTQLDAVTEFVRRGNSLLIFPGDQIDVRWYQSRLQADLGLTATRFDTLQSIAPKANKADDKANDKANDGADDKAAGSATGDSPKRRGNSIAGTRFDHPALDLFNDARHGELSDVSIRSWYRMTSDALFQVAVPQQTDDAGLAREGRVSGAANVIARLENGDAFLVESEFGKGRVIVCATSCDDAWTNLPSRPLFVPLMQRLVTYLAIAYEPPRNLSVGQAIVASMPPESETLTVTRPDGEQVDLRARPHHKGDVIEYVGTDLEGLYSIRAASQAAVHYAVIASRDESELALLDDEQLGSLAQRLDATIVRSTDEFIDQDSKRRYGREIWRYMYWTMLFLVLAEVVLQQVFSGVSRFRSGTPPTEVG